MHHGELQQRGIAAAAAVAHELDLTTSTPLQQPQQQQQQQTAEQHQMQFVEIPLQGARQSQGGPPYPNAAAHSEKKSPREEGPLADRQAAAGESAAEALE